MIVGKMIVGKMIVGKMIVGKMIVGKMIVGKMIVGKMVVGKIVVGKIVAISVLPARVWPAQRLERLAIKGPGMSKFGLFLLFLIIGMASLSADEPNATAAGQRNAESKRVVFLAGRPSHGYGAHEHYAGCMILARRLEEAKPDYKIEVFQHEWPQETEALAQADVIIMYCDGGQGHPVNKHLDLVDTLAKKGAGIVCLHYGVEVPKGEPGQKFLQWIGGYFETDWSVNPHWTADFNEFPDHPVARGVKPFSMQDEWYYHMRFVDDMKNVTPILTAIPPANTLSRPDGPHSGNPHVRATAGQPQHVAWCFERADGGRGFGFTGGHDHWNWGQEDFRKVVLNAIVWTARGEVPANGIEAAEVTLEQLKENQDYPIPENYNFDEAKRRMNFPGRGK